MAPDEKSVVAAQKLVSPRLWESPGLSESALWGTCGGGRNYQVRIDLANMGYSCNCPSRKFPCKHVLALMMLLATTPDAIAITESPQWVREWINKRRQREQAKADKEQQPAKPIDAAAQAKRVDERELKVAEGLKQLSVWMDDLIRGGIACLETKPFTFWDDQARRLVDSQAKGLATRIRNLAEIPQSSRDWPQRMMDELGRTRLLMHAYERSDNLSPDLKADVRQLIGWTVSQAELVESGEVVEDDWFIFGQQIKEEDRFRTQRSWAIGRTTQREALLLQFAPGVQGFPESIVPGTIQPGKLIFYPGTVQQRAKFQERTGENDSTFKDYIGGNSVTTFLGEYAERLAQNPWLPTCSCLLSDVTIATEHGAWFVRDSEGNALPLRMQDHYRLLSATGGHSFQLMGEWNGDVFAPMSFLFEGQFQVCS